MGFITDNSIAVCFLTETWLTDANNNVTATIKSYGFNIVHTVRKSTSKVRGGGVAIIYNSNVLNLSQVFLKCGASFEAVSAKFRDNQGENVLCSCVYRPGAINEAFFSEFDDYLGTIFLKFTNIVICGDLNIHLDNIKSSYSTKLFHLITSYGLHQYVKEPTHKHGHLLDVVISSSKGVDPSSVVVGHLDSQIFPKCDHLPVKFSFLRQSPECTNNKKTITFRNIKDMDHDQFSLDLLEVLEPLSVDDHVNESFENMICVYNDVCTALIDEHAPIITKVINDRPTAPWFDGEYKSLRTLRRQAEKKWKNTSSPTDRAHFELLRDKCNELADKKKHEFFHEQFLKHSFSPKSLYNFANTFLDHDKSLTLPPSDSLKDTVDKFNSFFQNKIETIRSNFKHKEVSAMSSSNDAAFTGEKLSSFEPTTVQEIEEILKDIQIKSSSVDPIPASVFKENSSILLPALCNIVNASLSNGSVEGVKLALTTPLIKGQGLDNSEFKNYRPISNLSFVGKLIERVVLKRLNDHLEKNNLNVRNQSGYKKMHSTETLLVRVVNDLLIASSESKATVVLLLDLSAAFDTVDHTKLLNILKLELGIEGTAWLWFRSFLTSRCQKIKIGDHESYEIIIKFGVPQGSVLGPVLFNIYIRSLYATVKDLNFAIQGYADDHQLYRSFTSLEEYTLFNEDVPQCFQQVEKWMGKHYLQINPGKTEIVVFGSPAVLNDLTLKGVFLNSKTCIRLSPVAKSLGFRLDSTLSFRHQVKSVKTASFLKLRNIGRMRSFLSTKQMSMLVQALIMSSLDYCNALYYGCAKSIINQLQNIQNRACRIIFGLHRKQPVDEKMKSLHWLKVEQRIEFKLCLLIYKALNGLAPSYICELITFNNISSRRTSSLHVPLVKESHPRAFQTLAPSLWNQLPLHIKTSKDVVSFKSLLKTHLFKKSYND